MPELPEVETVVRTLAPHLAGQTIVSAEFRSKFVTPGDRSKLAARLSRRRIESIARRGKFIWISLDSGSLAIHLGMTGRLLFNGVDGPHTHGLFQLASDALLVYDDPRQFGRIEWSEGRGRSSRQNRSRLDQSRSKFQRIEFVTSLRSRSTKVKPLLLNQAFLAGLGNIYVDEALFRASIHPNTPAARISKPRATLLHQAIVEVLRVAIEHRGSSISSIMSTPTASAAASKPCIRFMAAKAPAPAPAAVSPINRIVVSQRGTHYCPRCQKLPGSAR